MPPKKYVRGIVGTKSSSSIFSCLQVAHILGEADRPINKNMDAGKVKFSITAASLIRGISIWVKSAKENTIYFWLPLLSTPRLFFSSQIFIWLRRTVLPQPPTFRGSVVYRFTLSKFRNSLSPSQLSYHMRTETCGRDSETPVGARYCKALLTTMKVLHFFISPMGSYYWGGFWSQFYYSSNAMSSATTKCKHPTCWIPFVLTIVYTCLTAS